MVKEYDRRFGLDQPLWRQYVTYLSATTRLDFNYSIANYPRTVRELIAEAVPWTVGLLGVTTLLSFGIGKFLGCVAGLARRTTMDALADAAVMGTARHPVLPARPDPDVPPGVPVAFAADLGGYSAGALPSLSLGFVWDVISHALLPALSIVLVATGGWALGMRGMMVTTMGEDYVNFADAKGLRSSTIFLRYCLRNAMLPQTTALALALGQILSGAVLVEVIFGYPGIGTLLFQAIRENDTS